MEYEGRIRGGGVKHKTGETELEELTIFPSR
jgi:hypothetical protein